MNIIDKNKVLIKSKDFVKTFSIHQQDQTRKSYTLLIRFVFNLQKTIIKSECLTTSTSELMQSHFQRRIP